MENNDLILWSVCTAIGICLVNTIVMLILVKFSMNKTWKKFNKIILGSMIVRYFVITAVVWICIGVFGLHPLIFTLTFFISFFILMIIEILIINNRSKFVILHNYMLK